jgi:ATP-dependent RNA helicase RhlE
MTCTTFADLGVSDDICAALAARGITSPFPVQRLVLPVAGSGRDALVSSPTGSGKTLAFGLPLIQGLTRGGGRPAALVLAPTRELAVQIGEDLSPLAAVRGLRVAVCYGGVGLDAQATRAARADLLVATPGRLLDLTRRGRVALGGVGVLVIDEADRMLDLGFMPQVDALVRQTPRRRQTMLFSATLDGAVAGLAERFTRDPERLTMLEGVITGELLAERLDQSFVATSGTGRIDTLVELIEGEDDLVLVFCRTRRGADRLASRLVARGVAATPMHGSLSQVQRERALRGFARGSSRVMVATDVAARGIDLDDIGLVVNFDPPDDRDAYTHRVGRTARAGRPGRAVTMVCPEHADAVSRMAVSLGLDEGWEAATGYAPAPAPGVYSARRRGSAFAAPRPSRPRPAAGASPAPRANRVKRGSVRPAA